ncbi:hypothetical protein ABWL39_20470 [Chitinivorax sp. PXF-14]|uniref:hypothetical protein n=1 Tax=Chitinivorax sp. PXF-14 TaxID=3230488 RepID=UPI0034659C9A
MQANSSDAPQGKVLNMGFMARISLLNSVVRRLRAAGCRVLDERLEGLRPCVLIASAPPEGWRMGAVQRQRMDDGWRVSVVVDEIEIVWGESA